MKLLYIHTATLSRPDIAGTWDEAGNYIKPTRSQSTFKCVIHPDRKKSVYQDVLPEGIYIADYRIMRTKTQIYAADDDAGTPADEVIYKDITYVVFIANPWESGTGNLSHYECLLIRKDKLRV